ncbi:hypothetical protein ACS0TY_000774 [Phlomoides rotata]
MRNKTTKLRQRSPRIDCLHSSIASGQGLSNPYFSIQVINSSKTWIYHQKLSSR